MVRSMSNEDALNVPDAELAMLQYLWDHEQATARELTLAVYPSGGPTYVATVQKLLSRLEAKNCVERNRKVWPHLFRATVAKEDVLDSELRHSAKRLYEGSLQPMLTHLVKTVGISAEDRQSLRQLLDQLDQSGNDSRT